MVKSATVQIQDLQLADLPRVARIHMAAFPNSALTLLGAEVVRRYYEWQLTGPHDVAALGAFDGNDLLGYCFAGRFQGAMSGFLRKNRAYLIWRAGTHFWLFLDQIFRRRVAFGAAIFRRRPQNTTKAPGLTRSTNHSFGILAIAVDPCRQASGIGRLLMVAVEEIARRRGATEMALTVNRDNYQAIRFYESIGWEKTQTTGTWNGKMKKKLVNDQVLSTKAAISR